MTPEQFNGQWLETVKLLGEMKGRLDAIHAQNQDQSSALGRLDGKIDAVRAALSAKIDQEIAAVNGRVKEIDGRLRAVEIDNGRRTASIAVISAAAVAIVIDIGKSILKLKG